ncbi:MAG TPA: TIGR01777 family protein [Bacteroidales bacterium]|nr:TIGR01777 family protein [Bacteroidales bacterium]
MESILITGGSGLIGSHLSRKLKEKGYDIVLLSRTSRVNGNKNTYLWNPANNFIDPEAVCRADYIIHLAGAGIGDKRWTRKRRKEIFESRVNTAELIHKTVLDSGKNIKAFITISGSGYYGTLTSERIFNETDPPGADFLGKICMFWEQATDKFSEPGTRVVKIRTGIVLSGSGGVLSRIIPPVRYGIGSPIGTGNQYMPWIHIDDLCNIFIKAIEDQDLSGAYNAAAPEHITNRDLMKSLSKVLGKPYWFPAIPSFIMKMIFGEMSGILLEGSRVSCDKIRAAGFIFKFPELNTALRDLLQ